MVKYAGKLILFAILLCSTVAVKAQDNVIDQVIWVVGDEAILKSDVEEARIALIANGQRIEGDPYCFIPEQLAVRKLYLDQAKVDSIEVSAGDISRGVAMRENYYIKNIGSKEKLEEYWNMNIHQIREMLKEQVKTETLTEEVQKKLTAKIKLTPSEVRKFYSQLPKDSLPYIPTSVEVQIITNEPVTPLKELDVVKGRLRDFRDRIHSGEKDFATLALLYSEDKGSATNGGELGFMGRAVLDPAFSSVAFSLNDPKKISNIVETEFGFHIIQLVERRGDRANFRHILLTPKIPQEEFDKSIKFLQTVKDSISSNYMTFEAATFLSSDKDTRMSEGLMVTQKEGSDGYGVTTSRFIMEALPTDIGRIVDTMKIGEISAPFVMKKVSTGRDVVAIVKLKNRIEGHVANVAEDYEDLRVIVENRKKEEVLKKWVQRKIRDTYVFIEKDWKNCDFQYEGWIDDEDK